MFEEGPALCFKRVPAAGREVGESRSQGLVPGCGGRGGHLRVHVDRRWVT